MQEETFARRHQEASDLRGLLHPDRIFKIQAESVLIRRSRLKLFEETSTFEQHLLHLFLSGCLLIVVFFCYELIGYKLGRVVLSGSLAIFGTVGFRALHRGRLRDHVLKAWPWSGWQLFDLNILPNEDRVVTRRLCSFLDSAEGATESASNSHSLSSVKISSAGSRLYDFPIHSAGYLRLLVLEPARFDDAIVCRLVVCSFGQGKYDALSYVWGDARKTTSLTVNGKPFEIGVNLDTALRFLRYETRQRVLWVDAVCINQRDTIEKNYLVAAMSDIYQQAERVAVFLGPAHYHEFFLSCNKLASDHASDDYDLDDTVERFLESPGVEIAIREMLHILDRPWWSRAWVIQEIAYAKSDPFLMIGHRSLSARMIYRILEQFHDRIDHDRNPASSDNSDDGTFLRILEKAQSLLYWRARLNPVGHSVADLLQATHAQQATDPRDKVFAFQSLMMEPIRSAFAPDYGKSTGILYTRLATYLLCIERWNGLYHTFPIGFDKKSVTCPSWVPDFSSNHPDGCYALLWADAPPLRIRDLQAVVNSGMLTIRGAYCGEVGITSTLEADKGGEVSCHLLSEIQGPLSSLLQSTLEAIMKGKETRETDPLEQVYLAMRARPGAPFFTMQDLREFISEVSQAMPSKVTRLLASRNSQSSRSDTTERSNDVFLDALASGVRQTRQRLAVKWTDRVERKGLFMSEQRPGMHPPEMESLLQQYREDLRTNKIRSMSRQRNHLKSEGTGSVNQALSDHSMFTTDTGLVGMASQAVRLGDSVVVLYGIDTAFIARKCGNGKTMVLVGRVWLHQDVVAKVQKGVETADFEERLMYFE